MNDEIFEAGKKIFLQEFSKPCADHATPEILGLFDDSFFIVGVSVGQGSGGIPKKNVEVAKKINAMPLIAFDTSRTLSSNYEALAAVGICALARAACENFLNFAFIVKSGEMEKYADMYFRFSEALRGDLERRNESKTLTSDRFEQIKSAATEWTTKGKIKARSWLPNKTYIDIAKSLNLVTESGEKVDTLAIVQGIFWLSSSALHASSLSSELFTREGKLNVIPNRRILTILAVHTTFFNLYFSQIYAETFGFQHPDTHRRRIIKQLALHISGKSK